MRILYGVVGEGMGHAIRSRVVLDHLVSEGHQVHIVASQRAVDFLRRHFGEDSVSRIHGLHIVTEENRVRRGKTLWENVRDGAEALPGQIKAYFELIERFEPEAVVSDFESWTYLFGKAHRLPVFSVDNMQIINRCKHEKAVTEKKSFDFSVAKLAVKMKLPRAYHYLVTSFFFPKVRKKRTSLVPPILRPEILAARREPGDHVLVYQTAAQNEELVPMLKTLPYRFRVYGMGREGSEGNVTLCAFSETGFVDDLRTARAVIAGGGFSLMSEAVSLHVPMMSIPIEKQYEQELNARYLKYLGYGTWARTLDRDRVERFLSHSADHAHALESYVRRDNSMLFSCVDELITRRAADEPGPNVLTAESLGKWSE